MSTATDPWENALELLHGEVNDYQFNTWFRPMKPEMVGPNHIVVRIADKFNMGVIRSRYYLMVKNALDLSYGRPIELEFLPAEDVPERDMWRTSKSEPLDVMLNPKYTFDTFVVGASNRFAHAASLAVAELPSDAYNPLFLYGGVGLGKTHLMHAIGHYILANNPEAKLMYTTSENFTNQLIAAIAKKTNQELRDRLRNVDVLMVDDIQFIAGKTATQEEFFHTFNELHQSGKQIIISSDRPPKEIPTLEERLRSRFEWGLIADIQKPDYETRIAILRKKAELEHIDVGDSVLHYIAEKIESNIRELEGSLTRINAMATLSGSEISLDIAREALSGILPGGEKKAATPEDIMKKVADHYRVSEADMLSQRRNREVALARQVAMYLIRETTQLSTTRIGELFGGRDHSTVMYACDKIAEMAEKDEALGRDIKKLRE